MITLNTSRKLHIPTLLLNDYLSTEEYFLKLGLPEEEEIWNSLMFLQVMRFFGSNYIGN
jgi:hypothetical protein